MIFRRFFLLIFLISVHAFAQPPLKTIAIIEDQDSPYFKEITEGFLPELRKLGSDQYVVATKIFRAEAPTTTATRAAILRALQDPAIDAVFTAGVTSSHAAYQLAPELRTKPIIAGAMEFANVRDSLISPDGNSHAKNYSFVLVPKRIENDINTLARLANARTVDVVIGKRTAASLSGELAKAVARFEKENRIKLRVHPITWKKKNLLASVPTSSKAVYIPLLPQFNDKQRAAVFAELARRKIPNLGIMGPSDTDLGALSTLSPKVSQNLHRRLAVNFHQVLLGIGTEHLPAALHLADQLVINLATAKKIGWSPDYDTLLTAIFTHEEKVVDSAGTLTLESAMANAARRNPDIKAALAQWQAAQADTAISRAAFSTTAALTGQIGASGIHDRISPTTTPANTQTASLGFEVNRLLYSNRVYQAIAAKTQLQAASRLNAHSIQLDTVEATAHAYLDCLSAEALYRIQRENVLLVQENLGLAKVRRDIGSRDNTDYLRWLASLASARSSLIQADTNRLNARTRLNLLLVTPRQAHYTLTNITLGDDENYFLDGSLSRMIKNERQYQTFVSFIKQLARANSPELAAFDRNLRAQGILLKERSERHRKPEVKLTATARRFFSDTTFSRSGEQNEWTVGIGFTMPFFERDLQNAEMKSIQAGISQLHSQREKAGYLVEQRALAAAYNMAASHPAMRFARQASAAAEENFQLIKRRYSLGQVGVVTLLDAQSNWLTQRQAAATSTYTYLKDLISMQRSIAWYAYDKSPSQIKDFTRHFIDFQHTGSVHVRRPKK